MTAQHKRLLGLVVVLCLVAALVWAVARREEKGASVLPVQAGLDESYRDLRREIFKRFEEAAQMLNAETPKAFADNVVLVRVQTDQGTDREGPSMTYVYRLEVAAHAARAKAEEAQAPVIERVCAVPEMRDYMQYGVYYVYVYEDGEGNKLLDFRVDEEVCKAFEQKALQAAGS